MSYGVIFNAMDGNNHTKQQIIENDVPTKLMKNTFSRFMYMSKSVFMGWSTVPYGDAEYEDEEEVIDLAPNGAAINLYAVWEGDLESYHSYIFRPLKANASGTVNGDTTDLEDYSMATSAVSGILHIYSVDEMGDAGTKTITQNGVYNAVDDNWGGYSTVTVDVPVPQYANADVKRY